MALHLNLLHEEILEQRQRKRDPLKIGMIVLAGCGVILFLYYGWNAYRTIEIKSRLGRVTAELHVEYMRPTPLGPPVELRARVREVSGRRVTVDCTLRSNGVECAKGKVVAVRVQPSWGKKGSP